MLSAVRGEGVQGETKDVGWLVLLRRVGVQGEMGDGAMAKAHVSGEVDGVVQVPLC